MSQPRGSCLCGAVRFVVKGKISAVGQCHCSQCRKVSGTNGNAVFLVRKENFAWLEGEGHWKRFALPSGWSVLRCKTCGSPLPDSHDGERVWVIAGLMDDDLGVSIERHIFCGSRADWDREAEGARSFDEWPE